MISDFVSTWELFHQSYIAAWLIATLLSLLGVFLVARDQIFLGAAVSQASTLGIAAALWIAEWPSAEGIGWLQSELSPAILGVSFSLIATLLIARGAERAGESHEAFTGWMFLIAASLSVLLVSHSPHGLEEVHKLLFSTIIGATTTDVWVFAILAAVTIASLFLFHGKLLLSVTDPEMARASGINTRLCSVLFSIGLGIAIGWSLKVSGWLYTFSCLVLPALLAKSLSREVRTILILAPIIAVSTSGAGFVLANHYDHPFAQMAVALLGGLVGLAWFWRALKRRRART